MLGNPAEAHYKQRYTKHFNGNSELSALNTATTSTVTVASGLHRDKHKVFLKRFCINPAEGLWDANNARGHIGWTAQGSRTMTSRYEDQADFIPGSGHTLTCVAVATGHFSGNIDGPDLFFDVDIDSEVEIPIDENGDAKISWYAESSNFAANKAKWYYKGIIVIDEF
jgi:hypothetical protein